MDVKPLEIWWILSLTLKVKKISDSPWVCLAISPPIPNFLTPHLSKWPHYPKGQQDTLTRLSSSLIHHQLLSTQPPVQPVSPPFSPVFSLLRPCQFILTSHLGLCLRYNLSPASCSPHFSHPLPLNSTEQLHWTSWRTFQVLCPVTCLM